MATETITQALPSLTLRGASPESRQESGQESQAPAPYRYAHLLPHFSPTTYPPLEPFEHVDPGHRALSHPNPLSFLDGAESVIELTPRLGLEVRGVSLASLDSTGRDQLALEVRYVTSTERPGLALT